MHCGHAVQRTNWESLLANTFIYDIETIKPQARDSAVSFYSLNRGSVSDTEMDSMVGSEVFYCTPIIRCSHQVNTIADSLFALCVTLGTVPIIRCPPGNAAEAVAVRLDTKLRDNLKDARNSLFR